MNRIEAYLDAAKTADTPQHLLEAMAKLFEGTSAEEWNLLEIQLSVVLPRVCKLTDEEQQSVKVLQERRKEGDPTAIIGVHMLLFRVMMAQLSDFLNTLPHRES